MIEMSVQARIRHRCMELRDLCELYSDQEATVVMSDDTTLTYRRGEGAELRAGARTLSLTEEWIDSVGLVPS